MSGGALRLDAAARLLEPARAKCQAWLEEHREGERELAVPADVWPMLQPRLAKLGADHRVTCAIQSGTLVLSGPEKYVGDALKACKLFVRQHARTTASVTLTREDAALLALRLRAARGELEGATVALDRASGVATLKGTEDCVEKAQAAVRALVDEAARCAVEVALNGALEKCLSRPPLLKLQEALECALVADKATDPPTLSLRGRADAVAKMKLALERDYDVDEHEREMTARTIPVVIGKGGATIKRLQQESGAELSIDRASSTLRISGKRAAVAKAVAAVDAVLDALGFEIEISVQPRQVGMIVGRGGSNIKQLQSDTGASINIEKESGIVRIRGAKPAAERCAELTRQLLDANGVYPSAAPIAAPSAAPPSKPPGLT